MHWPHVYSCAPVLTRSEGPFRIRPIRWEDQEPIRLWRNEQLDVLRQDAPLTSQDQERYFREIVRPQLGMRHPPQVLLGYEQDGLLVGYGGIVHLDWRDRRGEISFLTRTDRAHGARLRADWLTYLGLLIPICRDELALHKLTTETYESRSDVRATLEDFGFEQEGVLRDHHLVDGRWTTSYAHGLLLD